MRSLQFRLLLAVIFTQSACVSHRQQQYFEVVDPETGNINFYRMTIMGGGGLGVDYQLQAGYFSAASVDVLRGRIPEIPEVDLPVENDAAFDALSARYYDALVAMSNDLPDGPAGDDSVLKRARLVWFGQLSPADVAAMGMNQSTNPFEFRKLVFWTSANNVDLRAYGGEIDAMIDSATTLVRAAKAQSKVEASHKKGVRDFILKMMETEPALAPFADSLKAMLGEESSTPDAANSARTTESMGGMDNH